ncbi:MAG: GNAT family N-acetyltransferase [Phycisphaerales bacterium]
MTSLAPIDVARLEERRKAIAVSEIALEAEPIMGGWMCSSGRGSWTNQAVGVALDAPVEAGDVDRMVDYFVSRGIEPRVDFCPFADESLMRELATRKFTIREFGNTLYLPLQEPRALDRLPTTLPDGVDLRVIDPANDADVETFVIASCTGFYPEGAEVPEHLLESVRRVVRHPRSVCFLATLDGEPVGGGGVEVTTLDSGETVAALFGVSVLHHARRRGIQAALIAARARHARDQGARFATIGSKPGIPTERNAGRLGFRMAYTLAVVAMAGEGLTPSP